MNRIQRLRTSFLKAKIDGYLVTKDINISYLTHFPASESWLFITRQGAYYLTDSRYFHEARKGLKGVTVIQYTSSIYESLFQLAGRLKLQKIGFDERHVSLFLSKKIVKSCPMAVKLVPVNDLVENVRAIKEPGEVIKIRQALRYHQEALKMLSRRIRPSVSEVEILACLKEFIRKRSLGFSFDPIVASGPNSSYPHAGVTKRRFKRNDIILIDIGIDVDGYKSDLTRIFFLGKIPNLILRVHDAVYEAQQRAIKTIRPGSKVAEIDQVARNFLREKALDRYFGHALGHGVGLEIHESPRLAQKDPSVLREGMVVTVEPGVYIPNQFGIRLEEMVLVTKKGCEVLSGNID